jgi:SAM-dependent methyltransferase|tara:strand:+ start:5466 stop:6647 length:1182 start_codon:yes stop_codon:yes gene_type:complete
MWKNYPSRMKETLKNVELEYYTKEEISPVEYNIPELNKHFEIRGNLYKLLGLVPSYLSGKDVLEVGAGSGHNSLYTSSLKPKNYDLIEPNKTGCENIKKVFANLDVEHTKPNLFELEIDNFNSDKFYDLVIAEGWPGGFLEHDRNMLVKIGSFVKHGGMLFIHYFPPIGGMATYLRRLISHRLINNIKKISDKLIILNEAFSTHLSNLSSMTRSHDHWILDSLLNPYVCVAYNTPLICKEIFDKKFKIYNSVPKFSTDWRWYKSLHGKQEKVNKNFYEDYILINHSMIDYRISNSKRSKNQNLELEKFCSTFALLTKENEQLNLESFLKNVKPTLDNIIKNVSDLSSQLINSLEEANSILQKEKITVENVRNMSDFSSLFGREQCYLSFVNEN